MVKCNICGNKIKEMWLGKIKGTMIKKAGKKCYVCFECQKKLKQKEDILEQIK